MGRIKVSVCVAVTILLMGTALSAEGILKMTPPELKERLGNADLVIIDVRSPHAWNLSRDKIKGAVREDPMDVESWIGKYPKEKTYVFYCT